MATEYSNNDVANYEAQLLKMFEAFDIIAAKNVESLQFDKTVKCSITDATKSNNGEYTVTDGSSTFKAYSESATYSEGASVYVSIPNGDYNNRKLIIGRYDENRSDYNEDDPEAGYIDITQNLITDFESNEKGLIANGDILQTTLWDSGEGFDYQFDNKDDEGYKAYKKLFVKGKFKSWMGRKNILLGNYGIRVDILATKENTTSQSVSEWYMYKLDSSEMIGDPFNFEVGFEQKMTFDLDPDLNINRIRVVFYQDKNFYNKSKNLITPSVQDDLFISEPYISLGYAMSDFDEDTILLYSFNSDKYAEYLTDEVKQTLINDKLSLEDLDKPEIYTEKLNELNQKKIILRWIHEKTSEDDITRQFESICKEDDVPEEAIVHWYKHNLKEGVSDELAGAFWEELTDLKNKFEYVFTPDISKDAERFRVVIEYYSREYVQDVLIKNDNDIIDIEEIPEENRTEDDNETLQNLKNTHLEKINTYFSENLVFTNENRVPDANTIDLIKGLEITCDDVEGGYNGVYRIYDDAGSIMSVAESTKKRILTANYTSIVSGITSLDTAEKIIWSIPLENTMIYAPTEGTEYSFYDSVGKLSQEDFNEKKDNYFTYDYSSSSYKKVTDWSESETYYTPNRTEIAIKDGYFEISRYGVAPDAAAGTEEADSTQQYFRIKDYYTQSAINNTVFCTIVKNNRQYTASFDMTFGPCGTNGTDFTFTMEFENKQPAITCTDKEVRIVPKIYDYQNKDVTETYVKQIKYSWYSSNTEYYSANKKNAIEIGSIEKDTGIVTLKINSNTMEDLNYFILKGCVSNVVNIKDLNRYSEDENVDGEVENESKENLRENTEDIDISLYSYLPIPIRRTDKYITFDGANKVAYNTSGVAPQYFQDPYMLYHYVNSKTTSVENINWMMSFGKDTQSTKGETSLRYYPTLDSDGKLIPTAMYLQDNGKQISVVGYSMGDNGIQFEWIQPLYIYQNVFSSSLLNSWDGSLTFDKENGTILSTMIGAGKKDSQNRFNGVLMGDLSPAFKTDECITGLKDYYNGIGLYGFNEGNKSFGLNINGRAFFGKSGKGQILIDGNSGTIQSQHFLASMKGYYNAEEDEPTDVTKAGMKIDLDNGILETYGLNSTAMIKIDPTANGSNGKEGTGPYFIIRSGKVDPERLTDVADIAVDALEQNKNGVNILYAGKEKYYLQSYNFIDKQFSVQTTDQNGEEVTRTYAGRGLKLDLMNGTLKGYDFSLKSQNSETGAFISINSEGSSSKPYLYIKGYSEDSKTLNDLIEFSSRKQYIQSLDYSSSLFTGTHFDLGKGKIISYSFTLQATSPLIDGKRYSFIINSNADKTNSTPLKIGDNFSVAWDGTVNAAYIKATGGRIGGWYISYNQVGIDSGIYSFDPTKSNQTGVALLAKGEIKVGKITTNEIECYMVYDEEKDEWNSSSSKPKDYNDLLSKGLVYTVYKDANNTAFQVNSNGQVQADGAILNSAKITKATLVNCTISSASVGTLTGGTITGAKVHGSTITGGSITGSSITANGRVSCEGLTISGKAFTPQPLDINAMWVDTGNLHGLQLVTSMTKLALSPNQTTGTNIGLTSAGGISGTITDSLGGNCEFQLNLPPHWHILNESEVKASQNFTLFYLKKISGNFLASEISQSTEGKS